MRDIFSETVGRWPGILQALGIEVGTGEHRPCPLCGGTDRFRFDNLEGRGTYHCSQCSPGNGVSLIQKYFSLDFRGACDKIRTVIDTAEYKIPKKKTVDTKRLMDRIHRTSNKTKEGDIVWRYLKNRGLNIDVNQTNIGTCLECFNPETKKKHPAMVATFRAPDGTPLTIHQTFLTPDGKKLRVDNPKRFLPINGSNLNGGCIRLFPHTNGTIGVCEGVENALAVHITRKIPVWATTTAILLESFEPPPGIDRLEIYGDNDLTYTGQKAAYSLANRMVVRKKIQTDVYIPTKTGTDFLDELQEEL